MNQKSTGHFEEGVSREGNYRTASVSGPAYRLQWGWWKQSEWTASQIEITQQAGKKCMRNIQPIAASQTDPRMSRCCTAKDAASVSAPGTADVAAFSVQKLKISPRRKSPARTRHRPECHRGRLLPPPVTSAGRLRKCTFFSLARSLARRRGAAPLLSVAALRRWRKRQKTVHATLKSKRVVPAQTATQRVSRLPLSPGAGHHKVPTSELSASAIFRRSSKQRDECLSPMRADEI